MAAHHSIPEASLAVDALLFGRDDGLPHDSSIRCDFLTLLFKRKLTHFVGSLSLTKLNELNRALAYALDLESR